MSGSELWNAVADGDFCSGSAGFSFPAGVILAVASQTDEHGGLDFLRP